MKELTKTYGTLLQDRRVKSEQTKYENFTRQRNTVLSKYKKVFQAFKDLIDGLMRAQSFYSEIKDTVDSLEKNVETFVNNRRSEGGQLLNQIERDKQHNAGSQADRERDRLRNLMERMSTDPSTTPFSTRQGSGRASSASRNSQPSDLALSKSSPVSPPYQPHFSASYSNGDTVRSPESDFQSYHKHRFDDVPHGSFQSNSADLGVDNQYNPMMYPFQTAMLPPHPQNFAQQSQHPQLQQIQHMPQGYVPPPPPPGPPPSSQSSYGFSGSSHPSGPSGYASHQTSRPSSTNPPHQNDPWAGLNAWK